MNQTCVFDATFGSALLSMTSAAAELYTDSRRLSDTPCFSPLEPHFGPRLPGKLHQWRATRVNDINADIGNVADSTDPVEGHRQRSA